MATRTPFAYGPLGQVLVATDDRWVCVGFDRAMVRDEREKVRRVGLLRPHDDAPMDAVADEEDEEYEDPQEEVLEAEDAEVLEAEGVPQSDVETR
jgi:hypothetical protein